jgi:hypothetical protein
MNVGLSQHMENGPTNKDNWVAIFGIQKDIESHVKNMVECRFVGNEPIGQNYTPFAYTFQQGPL